MINCVTPDSHISLFAQYDRPSKGWITYTNKFMYVFVVTVLYIVAIYITPPHFKD